MPELLETAMLICFGLSWPINLVKAIKSKTAKATSLKFLLLITIGYICGIAAKIAAHNYTYVFIVYLGNLVVGAANIAVYFVNKKRDAKREMQNEQA